MDLLLGSFADMHLPGFSIEQLERFEALLEESDPDLYDWVTGAQTIPPEHESDVMRQLCRHCFADDQTTRGANSADDPPCVAGPPITNGEAI
ncbi:MAG: succinate dehydrogenase assembly factor 2 [Pseudomonadota bacterium]|nr:succinate dehydrogenase assembly factor 2 [Pseudomonadota bacterium]